MATPKPTPTPSSNTTYQSTESQYAGPKGVISDPKGIEAQLYGLIGATGSDLVNKFRETVFIPMSRTGTWNSTILKLRAKGLSTNKSSDPTDITQSDVSAVVDMISRAAYANVQPSSWVALVDTVPATANAKTVDTTPRYSKQMSTAIKLLNADDAQQQLSDSWFNMFGSRPSTDNINQFMNAFNTEMTKQEKSTTSVTEQYTTYQARKDKSGKQVYDASGQPVYDAITKQNTVTKGAGFTAQEQQQFLADYLANNFGAKSTEELGGTAKTVYDQIVGAYKSNYADVPDFNTIAGAIKGVIDNPDAASQKTALEDYVNKNIRSVAAKKYAGIAQDVLAGSDVGTFANPIITMVGKNLETTVDINDPIVRQALNYSDGKGGFRVANDNELKALVMADRRYGNTTGAAQNAVTLAERLAQRLGR